MLLKKREREKCRQNLNPQTIQSILLNMTGFFFPERGLNGERFFFKKTDFFCLCDSYYIPPFYLYEHKACSTES